MYAVRIHDHDMRNSSRLEKKQTVRRLVVTRVMKGKMMLDHYLVMNQKILSRYVLPLCSATYQSCVVCNSTKLALSLGTFLICLECALNAASRVILSAYIVHALA
jgi:hypothetical protein